MSTAATPGDRPVTALGKPVPPEYDSWPPEEQKYFIKFGKLPNKNPLLRGQRRERKIFDSADDWSRSAAGGVQRGAANKLPPPAPAPAAHAEHTGTSAPAHHSDMTEQPVSGTLSDLHQ
eukprot:TRINITY_DN2440_c0_g1_i2.p2 TRINITY_DN2440_c0_g1~~TRINITY_DN2440_c0_g1_i2.p2  ORF type:complete len:119 (+),score=30.46 TRINITY_DN2440_c0_g1_i2:33-389(+)